MNAPYTFGERVPGLEWAHLKTRMIFEHHKWDLQSQDHCVLCDFPLLLPSSEWDRIARWAEALTREALNAEQEVLQRPELHRSLGLPRELRRALAPQKEGGPAPARVMRFDFHFTDTGWKISEVNADVPGGFIEASAFTRLMMECFPHTEAPPDPSRTYAAAILRHLPPSSVIALVYATAYSDDRQVMRCLGKHLAAMGAQAFLAGPANLHWKQGQAFLPAMYADRKVDAVVRFFPAEWLPRLQQNWLHFFSSGLTPINNPATAVVIQSKRFPLIWQELAADLSTWSALLPDTQDPRGRDCVADDWILKPIFGRVGEGIAMPGVTSSRHFRKLAWAARLHPSEWIAQRRFRAVATSQEGHSYYPSIGVYTVNGEAAGAYGRIARKPLIDHEAQDIAVLLTEGNA